MAFLAPIGAWIATNAGTIGAVSSVAGLGLSTLSSANQAGAQASAMRAQGKAAGYEAQSIQQQAAFDEEQHRRKAGLLIGKQRAMGAASGLDISSGSSLFAELDSLKQAELEALNIRHQGALGVSAKRYEAKLARFQGRRYRASIPGIYAGGALQAGSILGQWMRPSSYRAPYGPGF